MQNVAVISLLCLLTFGFQRTSSLADLLTSPELQRYQSKPEFRERIKLFDQVVERYVEQTVRLRKEARLSSLGHLLESYKKLAETIEGELDRPVNKKEKSREVKRLEIRLRKAHERFEEEQIAAPSEFWEQYQALLETNQKVRSKVMQVLFSGVYEKGKKQ